MNELRPVSVAAALFAGLAAWLSLGALGFAAEDGARLAVLPVSNQAVLAILLAIGSVIAFARAGASLAPVAILGLLILPWLPLGVPSAFLVWVWPAAAVVWVGVLLMMLASLSGWSRALAGLTAIRRPRVAAAVAAAAIFGTSAWRAAPMVPGGDEPHYLVITQSILLDRNLTIEDVHRRGDYRAYYAGDLAPHVQRRSRDGRIYSIHAPGLPAAIAPAFALGGYPAVVCVLVLLAAAGSALAWHLAWLWTRRADAAWFAWAAVTLPATAIFQSFTVYPDGPGGVLTLTGLWALLRADDEARSGVERVRPWLLHGAALALLPWFHSRFAVLAAGLGALVLLRLSATKNPAAKAVAFLAVPASSAILWVGYFVAIYGTPSPAAPYAPGNDSFRWVPGGLAGLLFDQRFGLITYAPVMLAAFAGLGVMLAQRSRRRLGLEILFIVTPYLLTVTHFAMWWGGWSAPARFFAPILPLFAIPAAAAWTAMPGRTSRVFVAASLALTAIASAIVVGVDRGRLAFNTREAPALWLEWLGRLTDLTAAAPMWARETNAPLFRAIFIWAAVLAGAWIVLRSIERSPRFRDPSVFHTASAIVLACVVMAALTVAWRVERSSGRKVVESQLHLLNAVASGERLIALQFVPLSLVSPANVPGRLRIEQVRPTRREPGRDTSSMFSLPVLPAGEYRLSIDPSGARGWLMIGIARDPRDPFAVRTVPLPVGWIDLRLPLPVRALVVRGDEDARRTVRGLAIEPLAVARPGERLTDAVARRAVRYDHSTVFFLDDRSFPEPEAFWVGGARESTVVIQPDETSSSVSIRLRNGAVDNRVTLVAGSWRRDLQMGPGEEQPIALPSDGARGGAVVTIQSVSGFRPAEHDPQSRDRRFLGVWVTVDGP